MASMGGVGVSSETAPPSDLDTIYQGGEFFLERMKAMGQQTAAAKKALSDLALGQEAVGANTAAKAALAEAQKAKDEASKTLADAKDQAVKLIAAAKAQGAQIVNDAQAAAVKMNAEFVGAKSKADEYAKKIRADADAALNDAKNNSALADQKLNAVTKAQNDATKAIAKAMADSEQANKTRKVYEDKIAKLQSVITDT